MIVMREIHLRLAAKAWLEQASRRSAEESLFRTSDEPSEQAQQKRGATWHSFAISELRSIH
jgi:hypothetical protein